VPSPVPYANLSNPQTLNLYAMVADDPESFADLDGHYWVEIVQNAGTTEFQVTREASSLEATLRHMGPWEKIIDFSARQNLGDTNLPSILPFRKFAFAGDKEEGLEPQRYSLSEGVKLDQRVFSAFEKEFGKLEQENLQGTQSFITLNKEQLGAFGAFHVAFRYGEEIKGLEKKLTNTKNEKKRERIQREIDKRKNSAEYKKYGKTVRKYIKDE